MADKSKRTQLIFVVLAIVLIFLWLMFASGKSLPDTIKSVAQSLGMPNVKGFDIDAGDSTYNIPGLKIRKGCGQMACSSNVIPITLNSLNLALPGGATLNTLAGSPTIAQYNRTVATADGYIEPPFYPFGATRMVGG